MFEIAFVYKELAAREKLACVETSLVKEINHIITDENGILSSIVEVKNGNYEFHLRQREATQVIAKSSGTKTIIKLEGIQKGKGTEKKRSRKLERVGSPS